MATSQIETVSSGADKAKLAAAVVLVVGSVAAFYLLSKQGAIAQWGVLLLGLVAATGVFFLLGALHGPRRPGGRKGYGVLAFLGAATGIGIAGRHVWVQLYPPLMPSCGPGWDYMIETNTWLGVVQKVLTAKGDCSTIDWSFLGLTMPMWSLVWFVLLAIWALWIGFRARKTSTFR